jgi:hypothetical protein
MSILLQATLQDDLGQQYDILFLLHIHTVTIHKLHCCHWLFQEPQQLYIHLLPIILQALS